MPNDQPTIKQREITAEESERLAKNFLHHPPTSEQTQRYWYLRNETKKLAVSYCQCAPQSRELSLALTKLEEAAMWVNAAIARNEGQDVPKA
jgi:hypothetical protein